MAVYFVECPSMDMVKIGMSERPLSRFVMFSGWSPAPLTFRAFATGDYVTEGYLLFKYRAHRVHHEWFRMVPELRAIVEEAETTGAISGAPMSESRSGGRLINHIRSVRQQLGMTREEMASVLGIKGPAVAELERDQQMPRTQASGRLIALAEERGLSITYSTLIEHVPEPAKRERATRMEFFDDGMSRRGRAA